MKILGASGDVSELCYINNFILTYSFSFVKLPARACRHWLSANNVDWLIPDWSELPRLDFQAIFIGENSVEFRVADTERG